MPVQLPQFTHLTYAENNPFLTGVDQSQEMVKNFLANKIAQVQAQYAQPMAQQALSQAQAGVGLTQAQTGQAAAEAAKTRFMTQNPQYISPEGMLISQALDQQKQQAQQQQMQQSQQPGAQTPQQQVGGAIANANQSQGMQAIRAQYHPDAMAFNPPQLPSPTGNPTVDNLYFKKFGMSPIMQAQLDLANSQTQKYQDQNIARNKDFNTQATFANESTLNAHKFLDALDRSRSLERGVIGGHSPAMSNAAQEMDTYGANMAAAATKLFQGENAVHASDIELQQAAKPNRKQNADVAFDLAQGVIAKNDRMKERQQFYSQGTQLGLKPEIMDAMWNKYETERPYINVDTKTPNDAYKGTWRDYLTPSSVNSFIQGKDFTPPNQAALNNANWNSQDLNTVKSWAKKNNLDPNSFNKQNLFKLARNENLSMAQLKQELAKRGAF